MTITRRKFFSQLVKSTAFLALAASVPKIAWAKWNEKAFRATDLSVAIKEKYGDLEIINSEAVNLKAPTIAENGAVVPIKIKTSLKEVKSISLFVKDNPSPLISTLNFGKGAIPEAQIRIRMAKTSDVIVLVESEGKLFRTKQEVKVTIGGCGG